MALDYAWLGEIRIFAFPNIPMNWAPLDGRRLAINNYPWAPYFMGFSFSDGPGTGTFQLPDLRGRSAIGASPAFPLGSMSGSESWTITAEQMPTHTHTIVAWNGASVVLPDKRYFGPVEDNGKIAAFNIYGASQPNVTLWSGTLGTAFAGAPHENRQPSMALNYSICLKGDIPQFNYADIDEGACIGEVRIFAFANAPDGFVPCDGSLLPIKDNEQLYALIGTIYGGDGVKTFAVPNLSGRVPIGVGTGPGGSTYPLGAAVGTESVTLNDHQMPVHNHAVSVSTDPATSTGPASCFGDVAPNALYQTAAPSLSLAKLDPGAVSAEGGSQPHDNIQPSLGLQFMICVRGTQPTF